MILQGFEANKEILSSRKIFLVCGNSFDSLDIAPYIMALNPVRFGGFTPNPHYEEVMDGVEAFRNSSCDTILAVGGGSGLDVAKAIKFYLESDTPIIAIPTTAGTGAESTHFAVIYKDGVKLSVGTLATLPDIVILEPSVLNTVPEYTRKVTMLDALCHAIESYWSKKATEESRALAKEAIEIVMRARDSYLLNTSEGNALMLKAANLAGQAINLTTTTAAHAMSYMLTSTYGLAHGHAVAICLPEVWRVNGSDVPGITCEEFETLIEELKLDYPVCANKEKELDVLAETVNLSRLGNNPVELDKATIRRMYERILK